MNPKPKLRYDCVYVPLEDGVLLQTGTGSVRLVGASLYQLVERIAPHLDGTKDVDTLLSGLTGERREVVRKLLETLVERGIAHDVANETPHGLEDWEVRRYAPEIAFAEQAGASAAYRFEQFRLSRVLLVGSGETLAALIRVVLRLGLRHPAVLPIADTQDYTGFLAQAREGDKLQDLTVLPPVDQVSTVDDLRPWLVDRDVVLHCADLAAPDQALVIARAARAAGIPSLHAIGAADGVWLGPTAGGATACWECAWLRHGDGLPEDAGSGTGQPGAARPGELDTALSGPLTGLVAGILAAVHFGAAVGVTPTQESHLTHLDPDTAVTVTHRFFPHPDCVSCGADRRSGGAETPTTAGTPDEADGRAEVEALERRAAEVVDRPLGLVTRLDESGHDQYPLRVVEAEMAGTPRGGRVVRAVGSSREAARLRAVVAGLELAALDRDRARPDGKPDGAIAAGLTWQEAVGRAALRALARACGDTAATGDALPADDAAPIDDRGDAGMRLLVRAAEVRGASLRLAVHDDVFGTATVYGPEGPLWTSRACTVDDAVGTAVEAAVATLFGHQVTGFDVRPDLGDAGWQERLDPLRDWLAEHGWLLLARPLACCAGTAHVLPHVAAVTLAPAPGRDS
jgi:bacteriocin biosynthesis cyclodehydratase domain-containing protein